MNFLKNIGKAVENAANYVGEKNRRAARLNRIRSVIRCQEKAAEKEYIALGRYYYYSLRDKGNAVTEPHCAALDQIEERLDGALEQLEKFYSAEDKEEITLEDVKAYDEEPVLKEPEDEPEAAISTETTPEAPVPAETTPEAQSQETPHETSVAPAEENNDLPFEG